MEMIRRRYGWMLRVGGHNIILTERDVDTLADLLERVEECGVDVPLGFSVTEKKEKAFTTSMAMSLEHGETLELPIDRVKPLSIRARLSELKRVTGAAFKTKCVGKIFKIQRI